MSDPELQFLDVGFDHAARRVAFRRRSGENPGLVWLAGFRSDMASTKAMALDAWCAANRRALLRFDYSGHGASGGRFEEGTLTRWLEESLAVFLAATVGPQILVGSSMGGYLALLIARELARIDQSHRVAGMILIAPAVDFTETLMWDGASPQARETIMRMGRCLRSTPYAEEPYPITRDLIEDGRRHLLLGGPIRTYAPARILQGMLDEDVPYAHAQTLVEHLVDDPVTLTLVKDGDHRLSRPGDLALLFGAIDAML